MSNETWSALLLRGSIGAVAKHRRMDDYKRLSLIRPSHGDYPRDSLLTSSNLPDNWLSETKPQGNFE
jgi:hypothetical protein